MDFTTVPILEGTTILLRPIEPEKDYKQWYTIMKDPKMHDWTGNTVPIDANEIKKLLETYKDLENIVAWSAILKSRDEW
ncbi:hypothetical protein [Bacillus pseudomycoides]|uniref:hypothetical protein n=1 Tax=Bacillus pseudomycoides TaxID=64104 RepID=UPI001FB26069|nr:hypothetical protein [Bacillus pseudomycoides]